MISLTLLFRIGAGSLACMMPLALYFLFLAALNQRRRPTMLTGRWDYTCLLLGLSGFILLGGPLIVGLVDSTWRNVWFGGNFADIKKVWDTNSVIWSVVVIGYFAAFGLLIGIFMILRSRVTVIYNIDPEILTSVLSAALVESGVRWQQVPGGFKIMTANKATAPSVQHRLHGEEMPANLVVHPFGLMRHASLTWTHDHASLRQQVEEAIDKALGTMEAPANPAGGWFMSTAVTILIIMLIWMIFLIWVMLYRPKGF